MAATIRKLSDALIAKIAAGEVIERPASVVKELVENAIDAGAKNIDILISEGGRQEIRVADDGCGMERDDLLLAVERHATSKLRDEGDLFRIQTLGFRGEALPSVAAVSWLVIESKGEGDGNRLEIEGGKVLRNSACGRAPGTTVTVRNLFFNTPARLKFLKSRETEFSHIAQWVEAAALSRPEVGFQLTHVTGGQSRRELQTVPRPSLRERISDLFGGEIGQSLRPVLAGRGGMEFNGFISAHEVTSASAKSLYFFVNGRSVRDRTLHHAVLSAYENLLMKHRYPWVFLSLTVSPDRVDVNVHPTKSEVRFAQGSLIHDLVREGVREALKGEVGRFERPGAGTSENEREKSDIGRGLEIDSGRNPTRWADTDFAARIERVGTGREETTTSPFSKPIRVLGQVHGTYLLCETPDKLILIDQHAAHERIGFEKLKRQFEAGRIEVQQLIPVTFELKPSDAAVLEIYVDQFKGFGLEIEPFGNNSFMLRTMPALLAGEDGIALIRDLVGEIPEFGELKPLEERVHRVLETIACHRQVRAGDPLKTEEIETLIDEMEKTRFSYSCPHGRPVKVEIPFAEIEKWFKRRV